MTDTLDAVVVTADWKLGLLLQSRTDPALRYMLGLEPSPDYCDPRVERIGETDVVGSCGSEKYQRMPNWKFVFDPRAKALVRYFTYAPVPVQRILLKNNGAIFSARNAERAFDVEYQPDREPAFRLLSAPLEAVFNAPVKPVPLNITLPRTTYDQFAAARPGRVAMGYVRAGTHLHDSPGPRVKENGQIWFGKSFYDGEGESGVGGFGSFDPVTGKLKLYSPPEIADWSVSAISAGPADIWMGLAQSGEGFNTSGGLLRFDRKTETVQKLSLNDVVGEIERLGDRILVATEVGIAIVESGQLHRYFIDRTSDGRWRVVEAR